MKNSFDSYISSISKKFTHEETSELGYRTDFEILVKEIFQSINVRRIDHDLKVSKGNKPDFIIKKNDIPLLYIETKDIGVSLDKMEKSEQMAQRPQRQAPHQRRYRTLSKNYVALVETDRIMKEIDEVGVM